MSHPARGAWIEIMYVLARMKRARQSHPARGAWIEIYAPALALSLPSSHPARGAWIEIQFILQKPIDISVAPRKGCVD